MGAALAAPDDSDLDLDKDGFQRSRLFPTGACGVSWPAFFVSEVQKHEG